MSEAFKGQNKAYAAVISMCPDMAVWLRPQHVSTALADNVRRNEALLQRLGERPKQVDNATLEQCIEAIPAVMAGRPTPLIWPLPAKPCPNLYLPDEGKADRI